MCCFIAVCKARGDNLRVHFKHCREIAHTIKGMNAIRAREFLENVVAHKEAVPFRRYTGGTSRHAQGKAMKAPGNCVRWPEKASKLFLDLLRNAVANAEVSTRGSRLFVVRMPGLLLLLCARKPGLWFLHSLYRSPRLGCKSLALAAFARLRFFPAAVLVL